MIKTGNTTSRRLLWTCALLAANSVAADYAVCQEQATDDGSGMQKAQSVELTIKAKLNYLLTLPEDYEGKDSHPLMLFLHGAGERGNDQLDRVKIHGPPKLIAAGKKFPCIVVAPQCPEKEWWEAAELSALLDHIEANYKVDPKRIYVTGLSMGGYGTWALAIREPNRFAAIAPICGGANVRALKYRDKITSAIWAFHGAKDNVVPMSELRDVQQALEEKGVDLRVTVYPEAGHDSWTNAYEDNDDLFEWLFAHSLD